METVRVIAIAAVQKNKPFRILNSNQNTAKQNICTCITKVKMMANDRLCCIIMSINEIDL